MTTEEKYNKALELARTYYNGGNEFLDTIFPELKESEDERIRRTLVEYFGPMAQLDLVRGVPIQKIRDWLEKQKEPENVSATTMIPSCWAEKQKEQKPAERQDYSDLNGLERAIHRGFLSAGVENVPVTIIKETAQDCLAQMKPTGWSEEDELFLGVCKNALSKYERSDKWDASIISKWLESRLKSSLPQPAGWSKVDKNRLEEAIEVVEANGCWVRSDDAVKQVSNFLKSLPERFNLQSKQEWSEEDDMLMDELESYILQDKEFNDEQKSWRIKRLKSLRPLKDCSSCAKNLEGYISGRSDAENKLLEQFDALVTPEDELHIKPRWKPSEEQMKALRLAIPIVKNCISGMVDHAEILESLDNDLKKLM